MSLFRFGFLAGHPSDGQSRPAETFERSRAAVLAAEESGFEAIFVSDHLWQTSAVRAGVSLLEADPEPWPTLEAYTALAAFSGITRSVLLSTLVSPVTLRNPALLAKIVTTLDVVSGGRAMLALGAGWAAGEQESYGIRFPPAGERLDRLEEAAHLCRVMLRDGAATINGSFYQVNHAVNLPAPVRREIPILIGGNGARRTLRIAAQYADACNLSGDPETVRRCLEALDRHADDIGRDPAEIWRTAILRAPQDIDDLLKEVESRFAAGVDGVVIAGSLPSADTVRAIGEALQTRFGI